MKPSWADAPEWAVCLVMDGDQAWYWCEREPLYYDSYDNYWVFGRPYGRRERACALSPVAYDSIEMRPDLIPPRTPDLIAERNRLLEELETERMRLACCGVVALSNTEGSAETARACLPKYWSASAGDVAAAVDREMALRHERDQLRQQVTAMQCALADADKQNLELRAKLAEAEKDAARHKEIETKAHNLLHALQVEVEQRNNGTWAGPKAHHRQAMIGVALAQRELMAAMGEVKS